MESDLHRIIYTDQELTEEHIRYFLYQILRGLKYIHSANVIHRDLKPSNLLVNEDCHVKIGDFGMARGIFHTRDEPCFYMTQYVATRWYRAPEILLALIEYGTAVDMWSVGCIFAEMLGRKHLFPGKDHLSQIKLIIGILGSPSESIMQQCQFDLIKRIVKHMGKKQAISWKTLFPNASKKALDLLSKILVMNPKDRISVGEALQHPYLDQYHDPDDEPICMPQFNFDFEKEDLSKEQFQDAIYKEIMEFHQPKTPTFSFNAVLRPAPKPQQTTEPDNRSEAAPPNILDFNEKKPDLPTLDTTGLMPSQIIDIEMLSAKSNDGKMEVHSAAKIEVKVVDKVAASQEPEHELPPPPTRPADNTTVSAGTKELIKKALLNASQRRQRSESATEDSENKRITAAQRQKEREEKRRKKKERANERLKKQKDKQSSSESLLSFEDRELLRRWAHMQTQPKIAPAGQTTTSTQSVSVTLHGNSLTITPMSQPVLQPVLQPVSTSSHLLCMQDFQNQLHQQTAATGHHHVVDVKPEQLLGAETIHQVLTPGRQTQSPPSHDIRQSVSPVSQALQHGTQNLSITDSAQDNQQLHVGLGQMPPPYLNPATTGASYMYQQASQSTGFTIADGGAQFINTGLHHHQTQYSDQAPNLQEPYTQSTGGLSTCSGNIPQTNSSVDTFSTISLDGLDFFSNMVQNSVSPPPAVQPCFEFQPYPDQLSEKSSVPCGYQSCSGSGASPLGSNSSSPEHPVCEGTYNQSIPFTHYSPAQAAVPFYPQETVQGGFTQVPQTSEPKFVPALKISCNSPPRAEAHADQIAVLSKQFSKSQVEDLLPPMLPLTPKGTGGGYGVGTDLDALMLDSQEHLDSNRVEQSPLSSSLLADWLDVRGNISVADIEALEREMNLPSPMAVSYSDASLPTS